MNVALEHNELQDPYKILGVSPEVRDDIAFQTPKNFKVLYQISVRDYLRECMLKKIDEVLAPFAELDELQERHRQLKTHKADYTDAEALHEWQAELEDNGLAQERLMRKLGVQNGDVNTRKTELRSTYHDAFSLISNRAARNTFAANELRAIHPGLKLAVEIVQQEEFHAAADELAHGSYMKDNEMLRAVRKGERLHSVQHEIEANPQRAAIIIGPLLRRVVDTEPGTLMRQYDTLLLQILDRQPEALSPEMVVAFAVNAELKHYKNEGSRAENLETLSDQMLTAYLSSLPMEKMEVQEYYAHRMDIVDRIQAGKEAVPEILNVYSRRSFDRQEYDFYSKSGKAELSKIIGVDLFQAEGAKRPKTRDLGDHDAHVMRAAP